MVQNGYGIDDQITLPTPVVNEMLFGEKAPAKMTFVQGFHGFFDYKREVAKLKASQ